MGGDRKGERKREGEREREKEVNVEKRGCFSGIVQIFDSVSILECSWECIVSYILEKRFQRLLSLPSLYVFFF